MRNIHRNCARPAVAAIVLAFASACNAPQQEAQVPAAPAAPTPEEKIARGAYITGFAGCNDCHTPGYFLGQPNEQLHLAGSDVGFFMPGLGYVYGPNLTPDPDTGLGNWTEEQIIAALRTGVRPDGRMLAPIMPWQAFASLTDEDAAAIAAYLKSLAPISRPSLPPTAADQMPPGAYMTIVFPPGVQPPGPPPGAAPAAAPPPPQ